MQRRPTEKWAALISWRKVYVYLDTTRGPHHRHGRQDVPDRGTRHRLRLPGVGDLRHCIDAAPLGKTPPFPIAPAVPRISTEAKGIPAHLGSVRKTVDPPYDDWS